jgi:CO dehydrogenase nickel-insertion accessory protein CooC1
MKIAFVGKGGSGKSTVSWLFSNHLAQQQADVLAIDADYNMDLLHNFHLSEADVPHYINTAEKDFYEYLQLQETDMYVDIPSKSDLPQFTFSPPDWFTKKYSFAINSSQSLRMMVTGMVPQDMLYGHRCGHAYISSLKYYIPLLHCATNEHVIIDAVAGTDLVSYGMFLGCDAVVVVVEETPHSVGVYDQISGITDTFSIPTFVVINKFRDTGRIKDFIATQADTIVGTIPFSESIIDYKYSDVAPNVKAVLGGIQEKLETHAFDTSAQWQRHVKWRKQYEMQLSENKKKAFQFIAT